MRDAMFKAFKKLLGVQNGHSRRSLVSRQRGNGPHTC